MRNSMASAKLVLPWLLPACTTTKGASSCRVRAWVPKARKPRISSDTRRGPVAAVTVSARSR